MPNNIQHLTDEQFTDLLLGSNPTSVREHLEACAQCSQEVERASGAIGTFEQQTRLWAERRAASSPIHASDRQPAFPWLHRPQAWTAAAFAIVLATGIGITVRQNQMRPTQQPVLTQTAAQVPPATLQSDNELLSAIDGELRTDDSVNANMYGLRTTSHGSRPKLLKRMSN
jgi:hypothetical protein